MRVDGFKVHAAACLAVLVAGIAALAVGAGGEGGVVLAGPQVLRLIHEAPAALASYLAVAVSGKFTFSANGKTATERFSVLGSADQKTALGTFDVPGQQALSLRLADNKMYVAVPEIAKNYYGGRSWVSCSATSGISGSAGPTADALGYLKLMPGATGDVQVVGHQAIDGVRTTHYRTRLDLVKVAQAEATRGLTISPEQIQQLQAAGVTTTPLDVWLDKQNSLRQFEIKMRIQTLTADLKINVKGSDRGPAVVVPSPAETLDSNPCQFMFQQLQSHLNG